MKVLIIGGVSSFVDSLIIKIRKDGHKVFLLTGDKYHKNTYERVFERYDFDYDSENLKEILESVNPDAILFMGAFDTNFVWNEERKATVHYISGLVNLLVAYSEYHNAKFIYLSSIEVFDKKLLNDNNDNNTSNTKNLKATSLLQAENLCIDFHKNSKLDIIICRLPFLYGDLKTTRDLDNNIVAKMWLNAMNYGEIINDNKIISILNIHDATEFIYQIIKAKTHKYFIYNLGSDDNILIEELAMKIINNTKENVKIINQDNSANRLVFDNNNFETEFGIKAIQNLDKNIKKIVTHLNKNKLYYLEGLITKRTLLTYLKEDSLWLIKALIPFIENIIVFIPFFMINNRSFGSEYFANLDPYLIYVLLFAVIYGQGQAVFSGILALAGYLFRLAYTRTGFDILLDYNTYIWIAQLFIVGLVVGYMRDEIHRIRNEAKDLEEHLQRQIVNIKDINSANVKVKDALEEEILIQDDSIGKIYSITSKLDSYMPEEVLFYAVEALSELINTRDIAIYNVVNKNYARLFSYGSDKARLLGNSIEYKELTAIYDVLCENKVFINKQMDEKYPLMANAIFENNEIKSIIMVWGLSWKQMTLGTANFLKAITFLIKDATIRANNYIKLLENERHIAGTKLYDSEAFESLMNAYQKAANNHLVDCTILKVLVNNDEELVAGITIANNLRSSDYVGIIKDKGLFVLLANTKIKDSELVQDRLRQLGYTIKVVEA